MDTSKALTKEMTALIDQLMADGDCHNSDIREWMAVFIDHDALARMELSSNDCSQYLPVGNPYKEMFTYTQPALVLELIHPSGNGIVDRIVMLSEDGVALIGRYTIPALTFDNSEAHFGPEAGWPAAEYIGYLSTDQILGYIKQIPAPLQRMVRAIETNYKLPPTPELFDGPYLEMDHLSKHLNILSVADTSMIRDDGQGQAPARAYSLSSPYWKDCENHVVLPEDESDDQASLFCVTGGQSPELILKMHKHDLWGHLQESSVFMSGLGVPGKAELSHPDLDILWNEELAYDYLKNAEVRIMEVASDAYIQEIRPITFIDGRFNMLNHFGAAEIKYASMIQFAVSSAHNRQFNAFILAGYDKVLITQTGMQGEDELDGLIIHGIMSVNEFADYMAAQPDLEHYIENNQFKASLGAKLC
ncbi:hypothetical protein [Neptuniibacter sp. QD37_11]|uniref:hypothetical protein n=1 Tax=Neptuniibacter sp. QD37_11 TaxID=3398209 RepID=UPI0039F55BE6